MLFEQEYEQALPVSVLPTHMALQLRLFMHERAAFLKFANSHTRERGYCLLFPSTVRENVPART